jgi:hypothetical protein
VIVLFVVFGDSIVDGFMHAYNSQFGKGSIYNPLHSFLHVRVFSHSRFVMEVYQWKGVNF